MSWVRDVIDYHCSDKTGEWDCQLRVTSNGHEMREIIISGDGNGFHALVGKYAFGLFIAFPQLGKSCELSDFSDLFWNTESIGRIFNKRDTKTIVIALTLLVEEGLELF